MPSYFYHLTFELYPTAEPRSDKHTKDHQDTDGIWLPPPETDIFGDLPTQTTRSESTTYLSRSQSYTEPSRPCAQPTLENVETPKPIPFDSGADSSASSAIIDCGTVSGSQRKPTDHREKKYEIVTERQWRQRTTSLPPPPSSAALKPGVASEDWRFGRVGIETIDLDSRREGNMAGQANGGASAAPSLGPDGVGTGKKADCLILRSRNTEVGWGVVHFYREGEETPFAEDFEDAQDNDDQQTTTGDEEYTTLCIPAVPAYMTAGDFLGFLGERWREDISHCRLVRTAKVNRYLALLRFRDGKRARVWRKEFDGKIFNTMEPQVCHAVFVRKITFATPASPDTREHASPSQPAHISSTLKPFPPPTPNLIELPTCPVCLERMDETNGLMTIPCSHVFHCTCLQNWKGAGCPVCRSTHASEPSPVHQTFDPSNPYTQPFASGPVSNMCAVCDDTEDIWICLICGYQGCGRYNGGHAKDHWKETAHSFSLEVQSQHVWDYAGDAWVHRLIRDKGDGKVVELPGRQNGGTGAGEAQDLVPRAKLEAVGVEYTHLLTSQLATQSTYYQEMIRKARDKAARADAELAAATKQAAEAQAKLETMEREHRALTSTTLPDLQRDLKRFTLKASKSETLARQLGKSLQEEKQVNEGLMKRIEHLQEADEAKRTKMEESRRELEELREMNRDLSMFISGQEKLKEMEREGQVGEGEVEGGSVAVGKKGKGRRKK